MIKVRGTLCVLSLVALWGCGRVEGPKTELKSEPAVFELLPLQKTAMQKMRVYCRACHAVGEQRFITSDDDQIVWDYIHAERAPISGKLWSTAIFDVLDWPSDRPPAFDEIMDPINNRDWMPKGVKRMQLADDKVDGVATRRKILEALRP